MASIDSFYSAHVTIDSLHHLVHKGVTFAASDFITGVGATSSVDILFQPTSYVHIAVINVGVSGDATVAAFEGTTFSAAGTALPIFNKNRMSTIVSTTTMTTGPTITADGTRIGITFLPGGGFLGGGASSSGSFDEFILQGGTNYLLRIDNEGVAAIDVGFNLVFYEPELL